MTSSESKVEAIIQLYNDKGDVEYDIGEKISQIEHGLQAADAAREKGYDIETQIAALLHDIGHLLDAERMADLGIKDHEKVGSDYLRQLGFPDKVCQLVRNHVNGKRYLVASNKDYSGKLSDASKQTMVHQGGPMSVEEQKEFENGPYFQDHLKFRELDEIAKVEDKITNTFQFYRSIMIQLIESQ